MVITSSPYRGQGSRYHSNLCQPLCAGTGIWNQICWTIKSRLLFVSHVFSLISLHRILIVSKFSFVINYILVESMYMPYIPNYIGTGIRTGPISYFILTKGSSRSGFIGCATIRIIGCVCGFVFCFILHLVLVCVIDWHVEITTPTYVWRKWSANFGSSSRKRKAASLVILSLFSLFVRQCLLRNIYWLQMILAIETSFFMRNCSMQFWLYYSYVS